MHEVWKTIEGYEAYEVSDLGSVRRRFSANYPAGRHLKPDVSSGGYHRVTLSQDGKAKRFLVHRLVAKAFLEDRSSEGLQVAHLDGDAGNNMAQNLQWATASENNLQKRDHGTAQCGERGGRAVLTEQDVRRIFELRKNRYGTTKQWGATRISKELNLPMRAVKHVISGTSWAHLEVSA